MSADEAFDNLMNRNALPIPVAGTGNGTSGPSGGGGMAGSMRVSALMEDEPSDYHPAGYAVDEDTRGVYSHPTVTDLDPVSDDEIADAREHGARILGRDSGDNPEEEYAGGDGIDYRDDGSDLGMARRLRRFAYLPLAGMDKFESDARNMASTLIALRPEQPSLAVTSAARGEGRTELAIRIALAVARRVGDKVLLVDFDIRRPQAGARLGVSSKYFILSDVLRGSCPLGEALVVGEEDNLYVLPSRALERDGDEILDGRQVRGLLSQLHALFDFIVIDCGPLTQADAMIVCRLAGSVALAGSCGVSGVAATIEAGGRLEAAGAHVAGVLLTGA